MKYYPIWKKTTTIFRGRVSFEVRLIILQQPKMAGFRGFPMELILKKDRNFLTILGSIFDTPHWQCWSAGFCGACFLEDLFSL